MSHTLIHCVVLLLTFPGEQTPVALLASGDVRLAPSGLGKLALTLLDPFRDRLYYQLKLQQRRTREELVSQGIMPPLKSPAAFHEQRRSLERARTEDYLKRKIRCRPVRSELVRMHILEETSAEPSLQAKQLQLKRARLADDLNDKISHRPGPIELVHKNILCPPLTCSPRTAICPHHRYHRRMSIKLIH
uniref:Phosphatase and actin regulator n=1 Tax=Mola mola TaxID=94237 RepID=A0A3Q3W771_MOLML